MTLHSGTRVKIVNGKYSGVTGVVACIYDSGTVDVDMFDGPDKGCIGHFEPGYLELV